MNQQIFEQWKTDKRIGSERPTDQRRTKERMKEPDKMINVIVQQKRTFMSVWHEIKINNKTEIKHVA